MIDFSIITSVYKNDKTEFVRTALDSMMVEQSVKPSEIILVRDGKVPEELEMLLTEYKSRYPEIFKLYA